MERKFKEHTVTPGDSADLREYLLGRAISDELREQIETRIILDPAYLDEVIVAEDDLIQEFADNSLSPGDRTDFLEKFLISDDRRDKLKFARTLQSYVDSLDKPEESQEFASPASAAKAKPRDSYFLFRRPVLAGALAAICLASILLFYLVWLRPKPDEGLASLNAAYRAARPIETRISGMDYSPYAVTRGGAGEATNKPERDRAEGILLGNASKNRNAANLHALGRMYLTKRDFDEAAAQLNASLELDANNAETLCDLGAAYLEKAKLAGTPSDKMELAGRALDKLDAALKVRPDLAPAHFNRALCLQFLKLNRQARDEWEQFLSLDNSSPWAEEARHYLESLNNLSLAPASSDDLQEAFLRSARENNEEDALRLSRSSRELITLKYLPQKLAMSIADGGGKDVLSALNYLGALESKHSSDKYAADLALFYNSLSKEKLAQLKTAEESVRSGYTLCLDDNFSAAQPRFEAAYEVFVQLGDIPEAIAAREFTAYCVYNLNRKSEAIATFREIDSASAQKGYKWINLLNRYWLIGGEESLSAKSSSEVRSEYETILTQAKQIGDPYLIQKVLLLLALRDRSVRQNNQMLGYLYELTAGADDDSGISVRQKARNFGEGGEALGTNDYTALASAFIKEGVGYAQLTDDNLFLINYEIDGGIVQTRVGDLSGARDLFKRAIDESEKLPDKARQEMLSGKAWLKLGHLEQESGAFREAVAAYDKSLEIAGATASPAFSYEARKSKLFALDAAGDETAVEEQLPAVLDMAEGFRGGILDEKERDTFFDGEQTVYDVAVVHALGRGNSAQAFNYAESSSARSLLDWLNSRGAVTGQGKDTGVVFDSPAKPLDLGEIQTRMPANVQILRYYQLKDRTIAWVISKEHFETVVLDLSAAGLDNLANSFTEHLQSDRFDDQSQVKSAASELYRILIEPAEKYLDREKQICVVPTRSISTLPFASLVDGDGQYVVRKWTLFYAASANALIHSSEKARERSPEIGSEVFLGIGNPDFSPEKFGSLPTLPDAETEVNQSAQNYKNRNVLLGRSAVKSAFTRLAPDADVIHFAGHYIVQEGSPLSSGLLFGGGEGGEILTNADVLRMNLQHVRLAVLSGCRTGVEAHFNGEGLIGLSRTFLAAGVPVVVAAQWSVETSSSAKLMADFHKFRQSSDGYSTAAALRLAQLNMLDAPGRNSAPYFWAGFAAYGGYAEF
jgi:CHAT domain-containing protein